MQGRVWLSAGIFVGLCVFSLLAAPVEIATAEDLSQLLDQVCQDLAAEQTPSSVASERCAELQMRLHHELRERLHERGTLTLDPEVLAESVALAMRWIEANPGKWGLEEAAEMVLGLSELAKQYGDELRDFLAQAKAAGYSPEELVRFVTELAQNVTEDSPAEEALEEVLDSVEELLEGEEHPEEIKEEGHSKAHDEEDHKATYDEDERPGEDEEKAPPAKEEHGPGKGKGDNEDEDDNGDRDHHGDHGSGKGKGGNGKDKDNGGGKGGDHDDEHEEGD
jgi:hypothetical protein